jgi:hypothetical protein
MRPHESKTDCVILDHAGLTYEHGFVDMEREWSLDGKKKRNNENVQAISIRVCENCFCAYSRREHPETCPECGEIGSVTDRKLQPVDGRGRLTEITPETMAKMKQLRRNEETAARTLSELIILGVNRGYKPAWAYRKYTERNQRRLNYARN